MEQFVKSLYDRLEGKPEMQTVLTNIMDGAIIEMHNNGILSRLPDELQEKIHSADPHERIKVKTAIAKDVAAQKFILSSKPIALKNGDLAHMIIVKYDPRFKNSIAICIQGGLEGLYLSGVYRRCEDEIMHYYIQTDATGEDYTDFRRLMLTVEDLYENFQINFMPTGRNAVPFDKVRISGSVPDSAKVTKKSKGLLGKLFGKK